MSPRKAEKPASEGPLNRLRNIGATLDRQTSKPPKLQTQAIRVELIGSDVCMAAGLSASGTAPVLSLCRQLVDAR